MNCEVLYVGQVDVEIVLESDDKDVDYSTATYLEMSVVREDGTSVARTPTVGDEKYQLVYRTVASDLTQAGKVTFQGWGYWTGGARHPTAEESWPVENPLIPRS